MRSISLLWRAGTALVLLALLISPFAVAGQEQASPAAQTDDPGVSSAQVGPVVRQSLHNDTSPALRDIKPSPSTAGPLREIPLGRLPKAKGGASGAGRPPLVQDRPGPISMPSPVANFEGINNVDSVLPPDTNGDIGYDPLSGTKYYMQWVNLSFEIWDVTNPASPVSLLGPLTGNTLWSGFGGVCETTNNGDPIVLFDPLANRWLGSQFALPNFPAGPFYECVAISESADPTGAWHRYEFLISDTKMDDYPKFGVWPDGYYMSVNQFAENSLDWAGAGAVAFERDMMLAGLAAQMVYFDVGAVTLNFGGMLPSDLDGPPPPAGTPNYFSEWDDSTWLGDPQDTLRIWEFHVDWATPANSTFGANASYDPNALVATSDVDPSVFGIPQPDGAPELDAIADRLMFRLQYRNFGTHQTLVSNHTVDADDTDHAGVHWFELRDDGSGWVLQQDGVYAPDGEHRWMGSVAMDASGDIALGYSVSSTSVYPSIRYAGRLESDPINTLPQAEVELIAGSGVQLFGIARWGDYSMMAVDPTDDCTFWYTQEYYEVTGDAPWQTRIGSFKFPTCTTGPSGTLQGTVTDSATGDPIPGAKVDLIPGGTTYTDEAGFYLFNLPVGTYEGIVSAFGYFPQIASGIEILEGQTTVRDFALDPAASGVVQGTVTDGSAHPGMPLYARLDITGYPGGPVFTDPVSGHYSVELPEGSTFTFTVSAVSGGYNAETRDVTPSAGGSTEDFALTVDETTCTAPGYYVNYTPVFLEEFESGALPAGWSVIDNTGDGGWLFDNPAGRDNLTGVGGGFAIVDSDYYGPDLFQDTALETPLLDFSGLAEVALLFNTDFNYYGGGLDEIADVDVSNDGGLNWTNVWQKTANYRGPAQEVVDITALAAGQPDAVVRFFYYNANYEWWWQVDNVSFGAPPTCDPIPGGLVVGHVWDANTGSPLNDALVASDGAPDESTVTGSTPDPLQGDGFYLLFSSLTGAQDFTASKGGGYGSDTQTVMVAADDSVSQDFNLSAGMLSADPAGFTVTLGSDKTGTETLTLSNTGGLAAAFTVLEANAPAPAAPQPTGPFADPGRHVGIKRLADRDARALIGYNPPEAAPLAGGEVISSWPTGLAYAWGIGFNTRDDDLWLGNIAVAGGDDLDYRFLTDGTNTGDTIDTSPWVGVFAADMTYNPFTGMLWQLDVGGDDCLHELDPVSMVSTGNSICPPFGTNERGLAYDPTTDTYYAGSWNDYIINHFAPDGTILDSVDTGLAISGLAFNPATSHLFVMTNSFEGLDVYVLDTSQDYQVVGGFNVEGFDGYDQAGLEIDCDGHLWAVNQAYQTVLEIDSGETGVCDWMDIPWLSEDPLSGSVAVGSDQAITLTFDTAGLDFGTYQAHLRLGEDTPYSLAAIPVTLVVVDTSSTIYLPLVFR